MKEAFRIEYILKKGSVQVLWKLISTPNGLSEWFADNVQSEGSIYTFQWGKIREQAEVLSVVQGESIRYRWMDEPADSFFEFSIQHSEMTGNISLWVTDYAEPEDQEDSVNLWNSEIEKLMRRSGM
ncbi:MAG: START-like domain-containing protein [Bacteroidales bacterium]|nr:START-like domain-containing protein [Bacteroidales bacterium]MDD3432040.1 START-like domain-containing protein [Bacteroidales bacterium]MDD4361954.1 START-like domain-containing protein [Bacteroidales bacterium]